ncbi:hypothetical protein AZ027_000517, partial [Klebsiella pneumoniae]
PWRRLPAVRHATGLNWRSAPRRWRRYGSPRSRSPPGRHSGRPAPGRAPGRHRPPSSAHFLHDGQDWRHEPDR